MPDFTCTRCGERFAVPQAAIDRYPGWSPRTCRRCRDTAKVPGPTAAPGVLLPFQGTRGGGRGARKSIQQQSGTDTVSLTTAEVLERFHDGPTDGVFTDGGCSPNPGPGAWAFAWVRGNELLAEGCGADPDTTNNRMELTAVLRALETLPRDADLVIHADSELVVKTFTQWAAGWKRAGWKRKTGAIANLDLVKAVDGLLTERPGVKFQWVPAHAGWRWNEYVDALAGAELAAR